MSSGKSNRQTFSLKRQKEEEETSFKYLRTNLNDSSEEKTA